MPECKIRGVSKRNSNMSEQRLRGNGNMFQELNWIPYNISILVIPHNISFIDVLMLRETSHVLQYQVISIRTPTLKHKIWISWQKMKTPLVKELISTSTMNLMQYIIGDFDSIYQGKTQFHSVSLWSGIDVGDLLDMFWCTSSHLLKNMGSKSWSRQKFWAIQFASLRKWIYIPIPGFSKH